ncbi:TPT-domain-containing protein [Canariomyces notabilis]|uniref:GDP-mannose transporter n=1 Tax=Canariomyces notabilis TaxID=2074819 RepID=A0AAN6TII4_9PEZI|nr:TPT-domain-containing protein [Canariomyces arenarius]
MGKRRAVSPYSSSPWPPSRVGAEKEHTRAGEDEEKSSLETGNDSRLGLLPENGTEKHQHAFNGSFTSALMWMTVNTLATIGIVFTNKAIFSEPSLKFAQLSFAAFHFCLTYLTLFTVSRPRFALFAPRHIPLRDIFPLSVAMSLNVILPNLSLAFSTVTFYQVARILLTPTVAALNYLLYGATLPRGALLALIPACLGVGMVSYYDSLPPPSSPSSSIITTTPTTTTTTTTTTITAVKTTSPIGIAFALAGILASSLYTVWISAYQRRLKVSSMQLLHNQAPISALLLLYVIPFVDVFPGSATTATTTTSWREAFKLLLLSGRGMLVLLSGVFAALINISQFFIVARAGPVSSTVVGHVKTCAIVALGWLVSGRAVTDRVAAGVLMALAGIIAYSAAMLRESGRVESSKRRQTAAAVR